MRKIRLTERDLITIIRRIVNEDDGGKETTTKKQKTEPMTPASASPSKPIPSPCPPPKNSPFHTDPNFCNSDYCPPYSNHPDCECCEPESSACTDPLWASLPMGGTQGTPNYNGGKNNYCDRCDASSNPAFPAIIIPHPNLGYTFQYSPSSGTNYCPCC
tara:strand:- start:1778 stop:2254 length:477 start_codon:yes stop_codon:yes gene_type:complete